jgi:hypothetical protein
LTDSRRAALPQAAEHLGPPDPALDYEERILKVTLDSDRQIIGLNILNLRSSLAGKVQQKSCKYFQTCNKF